MLDLFEYHRNGQHYRWSIENARRERVLVYSNRQVPVPGGPYPGLHVDHPTAPPYPDFPNTLPLQAGVQLDPLNLPYVKYNPVRSIAKQLYPHSLSFNRVLGFGGYGVAALFDVRDTTIGPDVPKQVVVKIDTKGEGINNEKRWLDVCICTIFHNRHLIGLLLTFTCMQYLQYAKHIVQRIHFPKKPPPPRATLKRKRPQRDSGDDDDDDDSDSDSDSESDNDGNGERPTLRRLPRRRPKDLGNIDSDHDLDSVIILEYLRRNNLSKWIGKMNREGDPTWWSNREMWIMAECSASCCSLYCEKRSSELKANVFAVFRAVVAMRYPPKLQRNFDVDGLDACGEQDEQIPPAEHRVESEDLVHFDLDPSNGMLGRI